MSQPIFFVDVDDTLIRSIGSKRIPIPNTVERIKSLHASGTIMYLWSSGGALYAEETAKELGIHGCFVMFLPKPTKYIDDQPVHEWRNCEHVYPQNV